VGAAAGSAIIADPLLTREAHAAFNDVYSAYHNNLVTGTTPSTVQENWVQAAVDACVKAMTGQSDVGKAWEAIFSGITASKKIAIKVNCLNTNVYPQLATVKALVKGMTQMLGNSYPAANISLFDNNLWKSSKVDSCYGASNLNALGIVHGEDTYASGTTVSIGGTTMYISKFWADADYGVSLAKMSPHHLYAGGLSGVIKNMMGALSTNNSATYKAKTGGGGFHDGSPFTAFRDLFTGYAKANLQLHVVDMLFACNHENASGWSKVVKRITMGQDPCAVDACNADMINALGMSLSNPVTKDVPNALAQAGVGNASYNKKEPTVSITPVAPSRDDLDKKIKDKRDGKINDADVKQEIKKYREQ
jgi:uncharacterized protein (DUF362 family)